MLGKFLQLMFPGTPYLHALFHLLAGLAGYTIFIMFSMIDIESRTKTHKYTAAVRYFPGKNGSIFSFPYISLKERSQWVYMAYPSVRIPSN